MIAAICEVQSTDGRRDEHLDIAASLRPILGEVEGFLCRCQSEGRVGDHPNPAQNAQVVDP
ncbi:hypothetical protein [Roseinatronobacter alkalisoli]|uniref:Uncharacterized protein n=1 Tax=Roseinatronobacter alkalisoli TaxID=3028235 RepID=A0ABT5TFN4_9RHOB|nr:hypothetical protein [Roseinatronobacter sp. HJB301]MDD7973932.1 hypothetical protein [Roseinatronobacter sp. HJB301]